MNTHASQAIIDGKREPLVAGQLKQLICSMMEVDPQEVDDAASLIDLGLDSVSMMRVSVVLKSHGYKVSLKEMLAEPTLAAWERLIQTSEPLEADQPRPARPQSCPTSAPMRQKWFN